MNEDEAKYSFLNYRRNKDEAKYSSTIDDLTLLEPCMGLVSPSQPIKEVLRRENQGLKV
jgi:hypothetical protein